MQKDSIWDGFKKLFPDYAEQTESYSKVGSKTLKLKMKTKDGSDKYLYFLYNDPWDWTFGSKVWRVRPRKIFKNNIDEVVNEIKEDTQNELDNNNQ